MKIIFRVSFISLAGIIAALLLVTSCFAQAVLQPESPSSSLEKSLRQFLQTWDNDKTTRYITAFHDLNSDGEPEAIVYLTGKWCGSGGCNTLILTQDAGSWRIVSNITNTRLPIRVLTNNSKQWHSIAVWVQGGGIQPSYEAELSFDGKSYPKNPTVLPARRSEEKSTGEEVIPVTKNSVPLFE